VSDDDEAGEADEYCQAAFCRAETVPAIAGNSRWIYLKSESPDASSAFTPTTVGDVKLRVHNMCFDPQHHVPTDPP